MDHQNTMTQRVQEESLKICFKKIMYFVPTSILVPALPAFERRDIQGLLLCDDFGNVPIECIPSLSDTDRKRKCTTELTGDCKQGQKHYQCISVLGSNCGFEFNRYCSLLPKAYIDLICFVFFRVLCIQTHMATDPSCCEGPF